MRSAYEANRADARIKWFVVHQQLSRPRHDERVAQGARFATWAGEPLETFDAAQRIVESGQEVVSR